MAGHNRSRPFSTLPLARPGPQTHPTLHAQNHGKVERFIQTLLRRWAYQRAYPNSGLRNAAAPQRLHRYDHLRPHARLGRKPPISRLTS